MFFGALDMRVLSSGERMIVKAVKAPVGDLRDRDDIDTWAVGIDVALHAERTVGTGPALS